VGFSCTLTSLSKSTALTRERAGTSCGRPELGALMVPQPSRGSQLFFLLFFSDVFLGKKGRGNSASVLQNRPRLFGSRAGEELQTHAGGGAAARTRLETHPCGSHGRADQKTPWRQCKKRSFGLEQNTLGARLPPLNHPREVQRHFRQARASRSECASH
jgi:hypothetical protein